MIGALDDSERLAPTEIAPSLSQQGLRRSDTFSDQFVVGIEACTILIFQGSGVGLAHLVCDIVRQRGVGDSPGQRSNPDIVACDNVFYFAEFHAVLLTLCLELVNSSRQGSDRVHAPVFGVVQIGPVYELLGPLAKRGVGQRHGGIFLPLARNFVLQLLVFRIVS